MLRLKVQTDPRVRKDTTVGAIMASMDNIHLLPTMVLRADFALVCAELLREHCQKLAVNVRLFVTELCPPVRRHRKEGDNEGPRKRKRTVANNRDPNRALNEMSNM